MAGIDPGTGPRIILRPVLLPEMEAGKGHGPGQGHLGPSEDLRGTPPTPVTAPVPLRGKPAGHLGETAEMVKNPLLTLGPADLILEAAAAGVPETILVT